MRQPFPSIAVAAGAALMMSGCATIYEGGLDYDKGWRVARIAELGLDNSLAKDPWTQCRTESPPGPSEAPRVAVVGYLGYRIKLYRIVRVAGAVALRKGNVVYININDCAQAAVPARSASSSVTGAARIAVPALPGSRPCSWEGSG